MQLSAIQLLSVAPGSSATCAAICVRQRPLAADRAASLGQTRHRRAATDLAAAASRAKVRVRRTQASLVGDRGAHGETVSQRRRLGNADHAAVSGEIGCDRDIGFLGRIEARVFFDQTGERARILHVGGVDLPERRHRDRVGALDQLALRRVKMTALGREQRRRVDQFARRRSRDDVVVETGRQGIEFQRHRRACTRRPRAAVRSPCRASAC